MDQYKIKFAISGVFASLTALWGWFGWLVLAFIFSLTLDYITGTIAAGKNGDWRSEIAREGLWHKLGSVVAVLVTAILDIVLGLIINHLPGIELPFTYTMLLCPIVLVWYILTELGSVVENASLLGAPIPPFLRGIILLCRSKTEQAGDKLSDQRK